MTREVAYSDRLDTAAAALEIALEDHEKLWQGPWYPQQGDVVELQIGYQDQTLLACGQFQVDELELNGPPDVFTIRALAAWITPAMRTRYSFGYENQTLAGIASAIAAKYNMSVVSSSGAANISFARVTQSRETDLSFLRRIALENGYNFSVRGEQLVFYAIEALESAPVAAALTRSDLMAFEIKDISYRIYKGAQFSYFDPASKQLIVQSAAPTGATPTGDTLKISTRAENGQQAALKAQSGLHLENKTKLTAQMMSPGATSLVTGNIVSISGFGAADGNYLIEAAMHRLRRAQGYTTEITARQLSAATGAS